MNLNNKRILSTCILFIMLSLSSCSQSTVQSVATDVSDLSINHLNFSAPVSNQFNFIVFGHSYGMPDSPDAIPSLTLIDNQQALLDMQPEFIFSLGDMVENPTMQQFSDLDTMLLSKFNMPVFNAVGNHDVKDRELYEVTFGHNTYYTFTYANAVFFILDTEIDDCYIEGDQLEMLQSSVEQALINDAVDTIFIMMHKVLYMDSHLMSVNASNMVKTNDLEMYKGHNFSDIIDSILIPAAKKKPVHIFAGDVGAFNGNLSPYYQKDDRTNLYMYASGLGDSDNDVVLIVNNDGQSVTVTPYLLVSGEELSIENYGPTYWEYIGRENERFMVIQSAINFGKECVFGVCRVGRNVFHLQCRYVYLILGLFLSGLIALVMIWTRKKKNLVKD